MRRGAGDSPLSEGVRGWLLQASSATSGPWMAISEELSMRSPPGMAGIALACFHDYSAFYTIFMDIKQYFAVTSVIYQKCT